MHAPPVTQRPDVATAATLTTRAERRRRSQFVTDALRRPAVAVPLALLLVTLIALADYVTGYEIRLAILYLLPIALATWTSGRVWGLLIAILGPALWAASFASLHAYSRDIYFYWDCLVMAATFLLFVELLARLHAALVRSDERFVRVLEGLFAAVYVTGDDGRVLFANRRLLKLFGGREPTVGDIAARFPVTSTAATEAGTSRDGLSSIGREAHDAEEGRCYVVQEGLIPWVDRSHARLNVMTDITDQKNAQALQREQQAAVEHTARLMNLAEAGATLAHELNQPLIAIVGYNAACLRLLDSTGDHMAELRTAMERLRAQAMRAGDIVHRLREITSRREPRLADGDIGEMIRQAVRWAETDLERAGVAVELAIDTDVPPVRADRILIEQVVLNLIQNAIDAMRGCDASRRRLVLAAQRGDGDSVAVTVSDGGIGVPAETADSLYTPFFTTKGGGLGLGLSICRSVVEMHGGRIWHTANANGGTAFHFALPCGEA